MKFKDVLSKVFDYRGKTPKKLGLDWTENGDILAISAKNIKKQQLVNLDKSHRGDEGLYHVWMKDGDLQPGDVLLTSEAPLGESYQVKHGDRFIVSQRVFGLRPNTNLVDVDYFAAYLSSNLFRKLLDSKATGTTVLGIKQSELLNLDIELPDINTQKKIGTLIRSLNAKIEITQLINDNLSQLMMLVFEKFQDENTFDESTIGAVASLSKGLSYKSEFLDPDNTNPDSKFFISLSNFDITGGFKFGKMKYYFGPYKERHIVHPGDLLSGATDVTQDRKILGSPVIVPNLAPDMLYSLDVFKIDVDEQLRNWLYMQMQTPSYRGQIEGAATGTTVLRVPKDVIENFKIALPDERQLDEFNTLITPFIKMQELNFDEIRKLEDTRDTLLAKLIN